MTVAANQERWTTCEESIDEGGLIVALTLLVALLAGSGGGSSTTSGGSTEGNTAEGAGSWSGYLNQVKRTWGCSPTRCSAPKSRRPPTPMS